LLVCACGGRNVFGARGSFDDAGGQSAGGTGGATNAEGAGPTLGSAATGGGQVSGPPGVSSPTVTEPGDAGIPEPVFVSPVATQLVDDMLYLAPDGPSVTGGWGTYSDRTVSWSQPPIFVTDAGVVAPAEGTPVSLYPTAEGPSTRMQRNRIDDSREPAKRCGVLGWGLTSRGLHPTGDRYR